MAATQYGTDLAVGVATLTGYVVQERGDGDAEVRMQDVFDEDGVLKTRIVFQIMPKLSLNLFALSATDVLADFPRGQLCTVTGLTAYFVDACNRTATEGATQVRVELTNIGIT